MSEDTIAEKFARWLAWKLPRRVVSWCFIRVVAHATCGKYSDQVVPELSAMDALGRWDRAVEDRPND